MINRSGLNTLRGSIGMGQGNIRNENTRSNDMFNSPYAQKSGYFQGGPNSGNAYPFGQQPQFGQFGGTNPFENAGSTTTPGKPVQEPGWNQWGFNGVVGGAGAPGKPVGTGFEQQRPMAPGPNGPMQDSMPAQSSPSIPAGPVMPQFVMGGANNPTVNLNGMDNSRRFVGRPQMTPQQMRGLQRPTGRPAEGWYGEFRNAGGTAGPDEGFNPIYPTKPVGI